MIFRRWRPPAAALVLELVELVGLPPSGRLRDGSPSGHVVFADRLLSGHRTRVSSVKPVQTWQVGFSGLHHVGPCRAHRLEWRGLAGRFRCCGARNEVTGGAYGGAE